MTMKQKYIVPVCEAAAAGISELICQSDFTQEVTIGDFTGEEDITF